jgi:hypothetical protein
VSANDQAFRDSRGTSRNRQGKGLAQVAATNDRSEVTINCQRDGAEEGRENAIAQRFQSAASPTEGTGNCLSITSFLGSDCDSTGDHTGDGDWPNRLACSMNSVVEKNDCETQTPGRFCSGNGSPGSTRSSDRRPGRLRHVEREDALDRVLWARSRHGAIGGSPGGFCRFSRACVPEIYRNMRAARVAHALARVQSNDPDSVPGWP